MTRYSSRKHGLPYCAQLPSQIIRNSALRHQSIGVATLPLVIDTFKLHGGVCDPAIVLRHITMGLAASRRANQLYIDTYATHAVDHRLTG